MTSAWRVRRSGWAAVVALLVAALAGGCATTTGARGSLSVVQPGRTVQQTLERAIGLLERYDCVSFAVDFLSPIRREAIADIAAYRRERACSPTDRGNLDDVLLALRLGLGARIDYQGVRAVIDLSGIGVKVQRLELVRYVDGRWYFNGF
jgi:hypothetical protein